MPYIDTNTRSTTPLANETQKLLGRFNLLHGVYVGFIKDAVDIQRNGRLRVWIPELGTAPDEEQGWITVNYCSPFAGATNVETTSKANIQQFEGTQTSYGIWMIPPDINNQVLVMFANGDTARGFWIGCVYNQYMNNMVPGMAVSANNYQYPGKCVPAAEYNKWDLKTTQPDRSIKPYEKTKFQGLGNQGLLTDCIRGITHSSARRESPSSVFGILTPGPPVVSDTAPEQIRRKGGSSFIMDDNTGSEYVQLTTKSGAQIKLDETDGFVYLINRDGTAWVQMDKDGNIDIFGARDISMRAQRDLNIRADRNVNIEAGQNIFMKAAKDTVEEKTNFTYDVNNVPQPSSIPVWNYKGEGKGDGGNIVMQALNNWHSTTKKNAFLTVTDDDFNINIGNSLNIQTKKGGQNFNSKQGIMLTTDATVDIASKGNIRIGSSGTISVVGIEGIVLCSDADINLNSVGNLKMTSASDASLTAINFNVFANTTISGGLTMGTKGASSGGTITGNISITGNLAVQGNTTLNTGSAASFTGRLSNSSQSPPVVTSPPALAQPNPGVAEGAMSSPPSRPAEIKPLNDKINILATWKDPESKFTRDSESFQTTVSRFPTYEPCPEHTDANISGYKPVLNEKDKTYEGSGAKGNDARAQPVESTTPGSNNTLIAADPVDSNTITKDINLADLRRQLIIHEGLVKKCYRDSVNLLTGGIGHLLRTNEIPKFPEGAPISDEQIEFWYSGDSSSAIKIAQDLIGEPWSNLSEVRKRAVIDLSYNLGKSKLSKFNNFLSSVKAGDYTTAGRELKDSKWYTQVGKRGPNIQMMIVQNVDPTSTSKQTTR